MTFNLIDKLYKNNIIERGDFTLKSGLKSDIYFDVRKAMSYPKLLEQIGNAIFAKIDAKYKGDYNNIVICGVPYGAVPISMQIGISKSIPMIMKRKEIKEHGHKNLIEGVYEKGDKCIVVEDVVTTGKSMLETVKELESCGLIIDHIISFIDRRRSAHLLYEEDGYDYSYILDMSMINEYENNRNLRQRLKNIVKKNYHLSKNEVLRTSLKIMTCGICYCSAGTLVGITLTRLRPPQRPGVRPIQSNRTTPLLFAYNVSFLLRPKFNPG